MKPRTVRFGVIGCGVIAFWAHLRALRRVRNAQLVAAADPDPAARVKASRLVSLPIYEHADELLHRDDIDAVVIATPTPLHAQLAIAASNARKHFYVEKPLAATRDEAYGMTEAAEQAGVTAAVGFNRRCHPVFEQARALIASGRIGRVRAVLSTSCEPAPPAGLAQWRRQRATGGGVLLDIASHHVDLVRWFLNEEPMEIDAQLTSEATEDDTAWLRLTMPGGCEVQSFFSFRTAIIDFMEFIGELGTLLLDRHRASFSLRFGRKFSYGVHTAWVLPGRDAAVCRLARLVRPSYDPSYGRALTAFVELINGGATHLATLNDGVRNLETILAAEAAAHRRIAKPVASDAS